MKEENEVFLDETVTKKTYDNLLERQEYFYYNRAVAEDTDEDDSEEIEAQGGHENYIYDYARPRKYILQQSSRFKFWFDMLIIVLASFNVFSIPFVIAFEPGFADHGAYVTLTWLITVIFVADIFINLRTTYINIRTGDEVWEPKMIAKKYVLGGRFWIDLLSAIPFDEFFPKGLIIRDFAALLGMLKAVRVMRLSKVIQSLNIRQDIKAYLKVLKLVFYLYIYIHFIACIFYYIVDVDKEWIPGLDFIYARTDIYTRDIDTKYYSALYHAVMLFGLNEVYAQTTLELAMFSLLMLSSSMVNAHVFGTMAVLVSEANKKQVQFQEQVDTSNTAMSNLKVKINLQRKVKEYMLVTKNNQEQQEELNEFMKHISPSLKIKVCRHIFTDAVNRCNSILFDSIQEDENSSKMIKYFVSNLSIELAQPEQIIIDQGSALDSDPNKNYLYLITRGECGILSKDTSVKVLFPGDHFGEVALLYKCKRTATVICNNYCTLGKMTETKLKDFLTKFPEGIEDRMRNMIYEYEDPLTLFLLESIDRIDYFQGVSERTKRDIVYSLNPVNFDKGALIFKPNEEADAMYIVDSGVVEVYIMIDKGVEFVIDRLYKGSIINHRSFLFNDVIDTYARCASLVSLFYIKIEDLTKIRERDALVDSQISTIEESMVYNENAIAIDYIISEKEQNRKKRPKALNERRNKLTHILKNAVMYHIGKNREKRKKPNLSDILFQAVEKKKREMQAARRKKANFDQIETKGNYLTEDEYEFVCEIVEKIYKVKAEHAIALETIQKKFELLLKNKPEIDIKKLFYSLKNISEIGGDPATLLARPSIMQIPENNQDEEEEDESDSKRL